ncbi:MAG TPA: acyltransferase family protein, partial [Opitutus sp.]|nr:acyltransferase family protein [Opitutus sp.]
LRLGVPFAIGTLLLAPLAYYPAYLQLAAEDAPHTFWRQWLALGAWPPGPLWFLPVLLAFDALAVLVLRFFPFWNEKPAALGSLTKTRPLSAYLTLLILAIAAYLPMSFVADPFGWWVWGPFVVQGSRWALYAVYFFFGVALSVGKVGGDLFTLTAKLGHRWKAWFAAAVFMFAAFALVLVAAFYADQQNSEHAFLVGVAARIAYAATGVTTSFAMLAFFTRSDAPHRPLFARLVPNAFAMYIVHHGIVTWLQYALLGTPLSATTKGIAVVFAAIVLSWTTAAALRKIPALERVLR